MRKTAIAAAGALILAGLGLAGPGLAAGQARHRDGERVEKIIVITDHDGQGDARGERRDGESRIRTFALQGADLSDCGGQRTVRESSDRDGRHRRVVICHMGGDAPRDGAIRAFSMDGIEAANCVGDRNARESGENGQHRQVVVCTRGSAASAAMQAERLEQMLGRINANSELTADQKERVTAALREAIEQLRTTP
jgi:hypothetical protein